VRADSFVVETDVHYPTDINLLWDAMRKLIEIIAGLCEDLDLTESPTVRIDVASLGEILCEFGASWKPRALAPAGGQREGARRASGR